MYESIFDNAYLIILVLVAALGSAYYTLALRKKNRNALEESSKQDRPRFFFERLPTFSFKPSSKEFTAKSIISYMALIFFCTVFLPDFILFQLGIHLFQPGSRSYSLDIYRLMGYHLGIFIVIISTILVGVIYRNKFFEILNIFELGPTTLASLKGSFLARKPFFICLALLEFPLLSNFVLTNLGYTNFSFYGFEIGVIVIMIFFIPLAAQIYAAFWSGMLSLRSIIRESLPSSRYSDVFFKIREMTSIWKWPFIIWITSTMLGVFLAPSVVFFYYVMWLYLLTALIFAISQVLVHRDLSRFKKLSLEEIERTNQQGQWELEISLLNDSGLSKEEIDKALKSYETGLNDVRKQVNKMPTWLFNNRLVIGLALYALTLAFIDSSIIIYLSPASGVGGT